MATPATTRRSAKRPPHSLRRKDLADLIGAGPFELRGASLRRLITRVAALRTRMHPRATTRLAHWPRILGLNESLLAYLAERGGIPWEPASACVYGMPRTVRLAAVQHYLATLERRQRDGTSQFWWATPDAVTWANSYYERLPRPVLDTVPSDATPTQLLEAVDRVMEGARTSAARIAAVRGTVYAGLGTWEVAALWRLGECPAADTAVYLAVVRALTMLGAMHAIYHVPEAFKCEAVQDEILRAGPSGPNSVLYHRIAIAVAEAPERARAMSIFRDCFQRLVAPSAMWLWRAAELACDPRVPAAMLRPAFEPSDVALFLASTQAHIRDAGLRLLALAGSTPRADDDGAP